jgi:hypothetical protein
VVATAAVAVAVVVVALPGKALPIAETTGSRKLSLNCTMGVTSVWQSDETIESDATLSGCCSVKCCATAPPKLSPTRCTVGRFSSVSTDCKLVTMRSKE